MLDFDVFLQVICAAEGQHEEHTEYGSPVSPVRDALWQDVVNKNSAEPQAAHLEGFWANNLVDFVDFWLDFERFVSKIAVILTILKAKIRRKS